MNKTNQKTIHELLRRFKTGNGKWTCITMRDPIQLGEYGRREVYSWEGIPLFQLDIRFNPPETKAFVIENWQELTASEQWKTVRETFNVPGLSGFIYKEDHP